MNNPRSSACTEIRIMSDSAIDTLPVSIRNLVVHDLEVGKLYLDCRYRSSGFLDGERFFMDLAILLAEREDRRQSS